MAGELKTVMEILTPRLDHIEARLELMNDWMHEIRGGLKATSLGLGVVIALLIKVLSGG